MKDLVEVIVKALVDSPEEVVVTEKKLIILQCSADHAFGGIG